MPLFFLQSLHLLFTHVNLFKNANAFKVGIPKSKTCDLTQEEKEHTQDSPASCPKEIHLNLNFAVAKAAYGLRPRAPTAQAGDDDDDAPTVRPTTTKSCVSIIHRQATTTPTGWRRQSCCVAVAHEVTERGPEEDDDGVIGRTVSSNFVE